MDTSISRHLHLRRLSFGVVSLFAALAIAFPATGISYAEAASPFAGNWRATDPADGSDIRLAIGGPPSGPFQITWTESYIGFCSGEAGIVRGMGWLDPNDANRLQASLRVECFASGNYVDFDWEWRYHSFSDTLSTNEGNGVVTVWTHPGHVQDQPPALNLRVNYGGDDWVESFYEAGHTAWVTLTDGDANMLATAELITEPKWYWDGGTGFSSLDSIWLDTEGNPMEYAPDIQPGFWVYGWMDNGASAQVQIGDTSGVIDLAADSIAGTILAPWFTEPVWVECLDWGSGGAPHPGRDAGEIQSDGSDPYACSWVGEWDIQPGQTVGVAYTGPDGQWVANSFVVPNPNFVAYVPGAIEGYDWPLGALVSLTINAGLPPDGYSKQAFSEQRPGGPQGATRVLFETWRDEFYFEEGDHITMTDGTVTKDTVVTGLEVTDIDVAAGTVSGRYDPGLSLWVWLYGEDGQVPATNPDQGTWIATFTQLPPGAWGGATQWEEDGDGTSLDFQVPMTYHVTATGDVLADDGVCTLREAVIAANTNTPSGEMSGECPAGLDSEMDTIILGAAQTYALTRDSTGEDAALDGDLDIWDNSAATDLRLVAADLNYAWISQDAAVDDRVMQNHGATVELLEIILRGGGNVGGGGGLLNSGTMTIVNGQVNFNTVNWSGGGIYNASTGSIAMYGGGIAGNAAPNNGGGAITNEGVLLLSGVSVMGNSSGHDGGGIHNSGSLTVDKSLLRANRSGGGGAALANMLEGTATVQNASRVEGNIGSTGALFNYGVLVVDSSQVTDNRADYGGGVSNWGGTVTLKNTTVANNTASASAGGIHNKNGGTVTIEDSSVVTGNTATWDGGGINNWDGTVIIRDSTISANSASQAGAGIFNLAVGTMTVANSLVIGNAAGWGGGGINNEGALTVVGSAILANSAVYNGDAVRSDTSIPYNTSVTGSCIVGNGSVAAYNVWAATQNATGNWWGDASGPSGAGPGSGDSVGSYIDFSGWLTSAPAICAP